MGSIVPVADVTQALDQIEQAHTNGANFANELMQQVHVFSTTLMRSAELFAQNVGSVSIDIEVPPMADLRDPPEVKEFKPSELQMPPDVKLQHEEQKPPKLITMSAVTAAVDEASKNGTALPGAIGGEDITILPNKPTNTLGSAPNGPGPFEGTVPGNLPQIIIPDSPVKPDLSAPASPSLYIPTLSPFGGSTPSYSEGSVRKPDPFWDTLKHWVPEPNPAISTALKEHLELLKARASKGGTGLPASVEYAMWNRERDREAYVMRGAEIDVLRQDAALGFPTPAGTAQAKLLKVRSDYSSKLISLGRDIAIKQAELELANIQKALEQIIPMEQMLVQHDISLVQIAAEAARRTNETALQIYDVYMKGFLAEQESRKIAIEVYKGQIQAYEAEIHAHVALIEAEKAKTEVNKVLLEQYTAELGVNNMLLEAYKTEIEAAVAKGKMEELKIRVFEAQISAFDAEVKGYVAQVQGKLAEIQAFGELVKVRQTELQAYTAEVEAATKEYEASVQYFKLLQDSDKLRVEMYKTALDANVSKAKVETEYASVNNQANAAHAQAIASFNNVQAQVWGASAQAHISAQTAASQAAKMNLDAVQASKAMMQDATKTAAQVFAQLVSSALSQQHYSVSASGSSSLGANLSESHSFSGE